MTTLPAAAQARAALLNTVREDFNPALVAIDEAQILRLDFANQPLSLMQTGLANKPAGIHLRSAIAYLLILNAQNFRFWDLQGGQFIRYAHEGQVGALGMRKAFDHAWGECETPKELYWQFIRSGIDGIFGAIAGKHERHLIMAEMLRESHVEMLSARLCIRALELGEFTLEDARDIAHAFPLSYGDAYLKKAQLALAEIAGFCAESNVAVDCSQLTLCADYQLPRVLRALGVLTYHPTLAQAIDSMQLIAQYSPEERALRSATVLAGESIAKTFDTTAAAVDNFLWTNRSLAGSSPFHLTLTSAY